jgi:Domain of Unknown Function (DUF1080)
MSRILAVCAAFALATSAFADDKPKPNTLTPKEIADGWILLFDGETTYGWKATEKKDNLKAELIVKDDALVIAAKGFSDGNSSAVPSAMTTTRFQCVELTGEYSSAFNGSRILIDYGTKGGIKVTLQPTLPDDWKSFSVTLAPEKTLLSIAGTDNLKAKGIVYDENKLITVGFALPIEKEGKIALRNLKLRPLNSKPLFNGKDLSGWSVNKADPKRMMSKWDVTKDGELSLKNGPGDLVSEKEFDNFALQVECKTLGEALNSGVFFRCVPGQYQNGYEAQIQNSYKPDDRTKPLDFGTGAIYRRIPARKVVSNDNEWFTMTVVAEGKHIATWVNGYQTVDWIDERPANDNPRNGYRTAKGPLSLQGHDKTTDLLFRNVRIAEMPVEKQK